VLTAHDAVARSLLTRLLEETERVNATEVGENIEAFEHVLAARGQMLEALERSVQALAAASLQARSSTNDGSRKSLLELASELERANTALMHSVRAERDLIAQALAAASRPDGVATMYGAGPPSALPHLDLRR
jgi:hypothetical protein